MIFPIAETEADSLVTGESMTWRDSVSRAAGDCNSGRSGGLGGVKRASTTKMNAQILSDHILGVTQRLETQKEIYSPSYYKAP